MSSPTFFFFFLVTHTLQTHSHWHESPSRPFHFISSRGLPHWVRTWSDGSDHRSTKNLIIFKMFFCRLLTFKKKKGGLMFLTPQSLLLNPPMLTTSIPDSFSLKRGRSAPALCLLWRVVSVLSEWPLHNRRDGDVRHADWLGGVLQAQRHWGDVWEVGAIQTGEQRIKIKKEKKKNEARW